MRRERINKWRENIYRVIFEADTPAGKLFDLLLIASILLSVIAVMLDSIKAVRVAYGAELRIVEWFFTILFTIEYLLRLWSIGNPFRYAASFFGLVDLFAFLPTYVSLILPGTQYLLVIRILRVLRIFRILKFAQHLREASLLVDALRESRRKVTVFFFTVLTLVTIFGALMYLIEGEEHGFANIPESVYWAIVTLTTVGYGDLSPQTPFGKALAAVIMIMGYSIIAVPTGIVTAEISRAMGRKVSTHVCPNCASEDHDSDASFCKRCGARL